MEKTVEQLAVEYEFGIGAIRQVIKQLPPSQARNNSIIFLDTSILWMQQAFNEADAAQKADDEK